MATRNGVNRMIAILRANHDDWRPSDDFAAMAESMLATYDDDTVARAAYKLNGTSSRKPRLADIKGAVEEIAAQTRRNQPEAPRFPSYHERPEWERREIDEARREFYRVWRALEAGADVETLYPADSEPVRLKHEMARKRAALDNARTS